MDEPDIVTDAEFETEEVRQRKWTCCKEEIPNVQIIFFVQVILVYIVVITCITNLALGNEPHDLWVSLVGSCLGYILPAPSLTL